MTTNSARLLLKSPAYKSWAKGENLAYAQTLIDECEKQKEQTNMLNKKPAPDLDDIFYDFWLAATLSPFAPRTNPSDNYRVADKFQNKKEPKPLDILAALGIGSEPEVTVNHPVFFNDLVAGDVLQEFHVSIGIFNLNENSLKVTVSEKNLLAITWEGGKFTSQIPTSLFPQSIKVSYEKGVVDVKIPVKEKQGVVLCAGLSKK